MRVGFFIPDSETCICLKSIKFRAQLFGITWLYFCINGTLLLKKKEGPSELIILIKRGPFISCRTAPASYFLRLTEPDLEEEEELREEPIEREPELDEPTLVEPELGRELLRPLR
mgnify:CR=1 FL=1